jgi:hypothetical protein
MKPEYVKPWVDALRSGKYKQCKSMLRVDGGHCCLGVLCDIVGVEWTKESDEFFSINGEFRVLPREVMEKVGMQTRQGAPSGGLFLSELNDGGKTFAEIADIIEADAEIL